MLSNARIAVVVPAYDEELLIAQTIGSIPEFVDCIVVVDDASRDATSAAARQTGDSRLVLLRHDENAGVGAAIATGYRTAFARGADIAVVMAADAQMDAADLPALLAPVLEGRADYAKGNRLAHPDAFRAMPFARYVGNVLFSWLTRRATGLRIGDSQCGYTAITRAAAERADICTMWPRYGYPNDVLSRLAVLGLRVVDVVVRPIYATEKSGLGLRHAFFVVPWVLGRAALRRIRVRTSSGERRSVVTAPSESGHVARDPSAQATSAPLDA